eukprot:GHVL01035061.1.p1 GENE.GHVL01035061.1~~GHVL01035061.1.p1  ORF type:complete len:103 (-),score=29.40 GHVL01035061.1:119-427(-)
MAANPAPISVSTVLKLSDAGVSPNAINSKDTSLQSDKYLCVRDALKGDTPTVYIFDLLNNGQVNTKPIKADACLMNPARNIIAGKGKNNNIYYCININKVKI